MYKIRGPGICADAAVKKSLICFRGVVLVTSLPRCFPRECAAAFLLDRHVLLGPQRPESGVKENEANLLLDRTAGIGSC